MINYMDYIERCFYSTTNWNTDNFNEYILSTSNNLINFPLPRGFRFDISSKATDYNYSSFSFSNTGKLSGSVAYLYCSQTLKNINSTKFVPLQNVVSGYRTIDPLPIGNMGAANSKQSMLYGKMYFPTQALEAMYIHRFSPTSQFILKCINLPKLTKKMNLNTGIMTFCLQNDFGRYSREFLFSTNEALLGFRFLYNFGYKDNKYRNLFDKNLSISRNFSTDSSMLSLGTELWYGALNMSPGFSSSLRYITHSTSTGKPLTLTLSTNPILGNISSSYSVRTSVSSTFSSRYDFNIYSYESNLSMGCELWQLSRSHYQRIDKEEKQLLTDKPDQETIKLMNGMQSPRELALNKNEDKDHFNKNFDYYSKEFLQNNDVIKTFSKLVNESDFSSVIKLSTSLQEKNLKFLWEGRFSGFLMSGGFCLNFPTLETPLVGLQIQYSS